MRSNNYRKCSHCLKERTLDGGCEVTPTRWLCALCWASHTRRRPKQ